MSRVALAIVIVVALFSGSSRAVPISQCSDGTGEVTCPAPNCTWVNATQECLSTCDVMRQEDCEEAWPHCTWDVNASLCSLPCNLNYNTSETCAFDPACQWLPTTEVCVWNCSAFEDETNCLSKECAWTGSQCRVSCEVLYGHNANASCAADRYCLFVPSVGCVPACDMRTTSSDCLYANGIHNETVCTWTGSTCNFTCPALSQQSCNRIDASSVCDWDPASVSCEVGCAYAHSGDAVGCEADIRCTWNSATQSCSPACALLNSAEACYLMETCLWNPASSNCGVNCNTTSPSICSMLSYCEWDPSAGIQGVCTPLCSIAYFTSADCTAVVGCEWDASNSVCRQASVTTTPAPSNTTAAPLTNTSAPQPPQTTTPPPSNTTVAPKNTSAPQPPQTTTPPPSNTTVGPKNTSAPQPPQTTTPPQPTATPLTNTSGPSPAPSITPAPPQTTSPPAGGCISILDPAACARRSDCMWDSLQHCVTVCAFATNATICAENDECAWVTSSATCLTACPYRTATTCETDDRCFWDGELCGDACGYKYSTAPACNAVGSGCTWDVAQGTCQIDCDRALSMARCNAASHCTWLDATMTCVDDAATIRITSAQFAKQIITPAYRPSLVNGLQVDLSNAFKAPIKVLSQVIIVAGDTTSVPFVAPSNVPTPAVITHSVGNAKDDGWLKNTVRAFAVNGGTEPLVVSEYVPPGPAAPPPPPPSMTMKMIILVAGCCVAALLGVSACAVWGWRHNPYAAARSPVRAADRFTTEEYERFKSMNERVVTYEEAGQLPPSSPYDHRVDAWPVVACCQMPTNTQRNAAKRAVWDAMCTTLFPAVFEHLTQIRIVVDEQGHIRSDAANAFRILRYHQAIRLHAQGKGNIEFVMNGGTRLVVMQGNVLVTGTVLRVAADNVRDIGVIREPFERGDFCTHTGTNEPRKIVFGRIRPASDSFVVATLSEATLRDLPTLRGLPPHWTGAMVESAVRLMLRVAGVLLESRRDFSDTVVGVHRGGGGAEGDDGGPGWRIRCETAEVVSVLATVVSRFWAVDDVLFFCGAAGIPIFPTRRVRTGAAATGPESDYSLRTISSADHLDHLIEANENDLTAQLVG